MKKAGKYFDQVVRKILEKEVGGFKALFPIWSDISGKILLDPIENFLYISYRFQEDWGR